MDSCVTITAQKVVELGRTDISIVEGVDSHNLLIKTEQW